MENLKLELPNIEFGSELASVIIELEHLRKEYIQGTTPPYIFFQIKKIFHILESVGSARIEGNRTTVTDYASALNEGKSIQSNENLAEISNLERALDYIDSSIEKGATITEFFIRELQQIVVDKLINEGDKGAGKYRDHGVRILGSTHVPPDMFLVPDLMHELVEFINRDDKSQYDLIKVALVHHRFGWIHPFGNGNGRTVRLLTYALLLKYGFNVGDYGRLINPTAIFCCDRDKYYEMLTKADSGTEKGIYEWCLYVLKGLLHERKKLDILLRYDSVKEKILLNSLNAALKASQISHEEYEALKLATNEGELEAKDLIGKFNLKANKASYFIKNMREKKLICPREEGKRSYILNLSAPPLMMGIIKSLENLDLIPQSITKN